MPAVCRKTGLRRGGARAVHALGLNSAAEHSLHRAKQFHRLVEAALGEPAGVQGHRDDKLNGVQAVPDRVKQPIAQQPCDGKLSPEFELPDKDVGRMGIPHGGQRCIEGRRGFETFSAGLAPDGRHCASGAGAFARLQHGHAIGAEQGRSAGRNAQSAILVQQESA